MKSMLASKNTIPAVTSTAGGYHWISVLAGELAVRLRESRQVTPGLWPKTIVLSTRSALAANPWQHRTVQMPFPFTRHLDADYIAKYGRKLWDDNIGKRERIKLTNISLQFTGLAKLETGQRGIEGFLSKGTAKPAASPLAVMEEADIKSEGPKRERSASAALEPARKRSKGSTGVEPFFPRSSSTPDTPNAPITVVDSDSASASGSATPAPVPHCDLPQPSGSAEGRKAVDEEDDKSWTCPECSERFTLPEHVPASEAGDWKRGSKQEHADFHFALSLQNGISPPRQARPAQTQSSSSSGRGKKRKGHNDIKSFFAPRK